MGELTPTIEQHKNGNFRMEYRHRNPLVVQVL